MSDRLRFSLLGHPVRHSVSPAMCTAGFAALGLPHVYTAIDVPSSAGLRRIIDDLRAGTSAGFNVTVPYKRTVLDLVDALDPTAHEAQAANVLVAGPGGRITAHNTDSAALAAEIAAVWGDRPRQRAAILGAGGAGLGALVACRKLGFQVICMTSRSWVDSESMVEAPTAKLARSFGALTVLWPRLGEQPAATKLSQELRLQWGELVGKADCVIQATSAGMHGADPGEDVSRLVPWSRLPAHAVAYDLVYNPPDTAFLREARARGLLALGGLGMLVRQAALAFEIWIGKSPPLDPMRKAAEDALASWVPGR